MSIRKGSATPAVTLHKTGGQWTVAAARATIPRTSRNSANCSLALGDAKMVEEKTSDPANYSIIGVEDPTKPGAGGARSA